ncbi:type I-MYXAN CRISPR-associated protein Cas6/Cmx6 [Melittangium boletus]|uniref:type I-MYXAN CRISPR-associated protein Cas6/Cmx6 n=1 Tax=Melittangium boletus TaxID=83453 RepID=UPI003DA4BEDA
MPTVDLVFQARGGAVPLDHGYGLFSALASQVPALHERRDVGVFTLRGQSTPGDTLRLAPGALRIRCPAEAIPLFLGLTGQGLTLLGQRLTLGAPTVRALVPVPELSARLVTFKHALEEQAFREAAYRFIYELTGGGCTLRVGRRRIVTIAGAKVVGFALDLSGLSETASLVLLERGLGGRRHMGCGLFLPTPESRAQEAAHARAAS